MVPGTQIAEIFYDIRKLYQFRTPVPELATFIEFFSETSLDATQKFISTERFTVSLFPSFTPTIWINLGSPYTLSSESEIKHIDQEEDVLVLRSTVLQRNNFASDNIFTIKFHPLGFESIFGVSQAKIGDDIIPASDILPTPVIRKLKEPVGLEAKAVFLESFFLDKLQRNTQDVYHLNCIRKSMDVFLSAGMNIRLSEVASQVHVSEKTFNRYFHQIIGTNPKDFFATVRCRLSLRGYTKDPKNFSPYDYGYYDFSHFSREVKRFTTTNLTSLLKS